LGGWENPRLGKKGLTGEVNKQKDLFQSVARGPLPTATRWGAERRKKKKKKGKQGCSVSEGGKKKR